MFIITGKNITQRVAEVWREAEKFRRLRTIRFPPLPSAFSATLRVVFLTKARPSCEGRGGSVSRILSTLAGRDVIPLGPASLLASSNLPAGSIGRILTDCSARRLIWSCSVRGLPCPLCHQRGGGLLPHPFTLACAPKSHRRSALCCTFRRITPPWRYQAHCPAESGLSSALANSDALIHLFRLSGMRR